MSEPNQSQAAGTGNLFSKLYKNSKETLGEQNQGLAERGLQRRLQSKYDDALGKIDQKKQEINLERGKLGACNFDKIFELKEEIAGLERAADYAKAEYLELFGTTIQG